MPPKRNAAQNRAVGKKASTPYDRDRQANRAKNSEPLGSISAEQSSNLETPESVALKIFCIVNDGESSFPEGVSSFPVEIHSTQSVADLKDAIKVKKEHRLNHIDADELTLKLIPNGGATKKGLGKLAKGSLVELDDELEKLSTYFPDKSAEGLIHIVVKLPKQERFSKKARTIGEAISIARLGKKAQGNEQKPRLSLLNPKERIKVLSHYDRDEVTAGTFYSISETARAFRESGTVVQDILTSGGSEFPVVGTKDLYIREEYRELYDRIKSQFTLPAKSLRQNRLILTGT
ncbi:hypothetical protein BGX21_005990, partial [Mortierella sp. AD011]